MATGSFMSHNYSSSQRYLSTTEKMQRRRIRAHYEQLSNFERGRIIGLKEAVFRDESLFQLCPDNHRKHVWRRRGQRADLTFTIARHSGLNQELWSVPSPYFSEDKARPHAARVAMNCLVAFQTLPCPARSPDLSSIEQVWEMIGRRVNLLGNVDDLARRLEQILQEILQETIRVLYPSMPCRVATCIQVRGGSIPYSSRYFVTI
ncbi:transposable element Tc1 transposase [Trichonephila clavipes]|nr:transposable element Tc1 transposase [Trichonephila clavipes]